MKKVSKAKLLRFYRTVCRLTVEHGSLTGSGWTGTGQKLKRDDYAVIFPTDLGEALESVNKNWWKLRGQKS